MKGTRSTKIDLSRVSEIISRGRLALTPLHPIKVSAREFLRRCNGARSYAGIIDELGRQFNVDRETVLRSLSGFVEEAVRRNHLALLDQPGERPICVTESDQYFAPLHAQLELTDRCNLACIETNGTAITEKMADQIARSRKVMLSVSLDGATPETVDEMAMTVLRRNLKEAEAMLLLAKELGASSFSLGPPVPMGRAALNKHELIADEEMHQFHEWMMDPYKRHTCS